MRNICCPEGAEEGKVRDGKGCGGNGRMGIEAGEIFGVREGSDEWELLGNTEE